MNARYTRPASLAAALLVAAVTSICGAQTLDDELRGMSTVELARLSQSSGDPARGAIVFFQHQMACAKCHSVDDKQSPLGPNLATLAKETTTEALIESVLLPSKSIRKGYESVTITLASGKSLTGLLVERTDDKVVLRDIARDGAVVTLPRAEIDEVQGNPLSLMPAGQTNQLASRQQFYDLISYLVELRDGGVERARELQPSPTLLTLKLPEYEAHLDHAALIASWNGESLKRGEAIYQRVCANCHGTHDRPGSLPTSLRFGEGKFKNGSDPLAMYQTLTRGFGQMAPQTWMVPSQKYDVIHYIRETYLRTHNPSQFVKVDNAYLKRLPPGNTRGPEPSKIQPWSAMDYGPSLTHTYEIPNGPLNIAYKGIAIRLDAGAGGVSRGRHWMMFDTDTLRMAAAWSAAGDSENFIDWRGIQFNGEHQIHPRITGHITLANGNQPGWADPATNSFKDDQRVEGRDGRRYGPLPAAWGKFQGVYHHHQQVVLSYSVGDTKILELPRVQTSDAASAVFLRTFHIGPRSDDLHLQVAEHSKPDCVATPIAGHDSAVVFGPATKDAEPRQDAASAPLRFDGQSYVEIDAQQAFDVTTQDFTIVAKIKTDVGGTIFALTEPGEKWVADGQSFFIRDGRLCFDIGWVGAVTSKTKINDGKWHHVAVTSTQSTQQVQLYIDGRLDGAGKLAAKARLKKPVARIGYTAPNFPQPHSYFQGELAEVRFYKKVLTENLDELAKVKHNDALVGRWVLDNAKGKSVADATEHHHDGTVHHGEAKPTEPAVALAAGFAPADTNAQWSSIEGRLVLKVPAGKQPITFTVWMTEKPSAGDAEPPVISDATPDLVALTRGGPARWPQPLVTQATIGQDDGPFAVDVLTAPEPNPWLAQTRFTGLDFFQDGSLAVCTWDGDVWRVTGDLKDSQFNWRRMATGLFQPLGLKVINDKVHVTCRDQLAVLHDLNDDGEIDFYECLNNDHQVTEHFHEFAMGLQTDAEGNFYYAKSGRHALAAVVPHHGTLLRVSKDGTRTDILATGFRAANGVCLNPDGSFVVTDQEGFWNPKNRINWVKLNPSGKPNFYGNMFGYTDVTDSSDSAMVPPLCWITNTFDRSPAELLWVTSKRWGPLQNSLLNLSYGYGKVFLVPHESVDGTMQGGMIELPIPAFPTGVMRGRFHPTDGQLYLCGMFAWAGSATQPGGLYRLRATGQPVHLPVQLQAKKGALHVTFTSPLDRAHLDAKSVSIKTWSLKRTANYGSKHYDEQPLEIRQVTLSDDGKTVQIETPDLHPTWCMEIKFELRSATGKPVVGTLHNTIHKLAD